MLSAAHCFYDQGIRLDHKKMAIVAGSTDPTNEGNLLKVIDNKTAGRNLEGLSKTLLMRKQNCSWIYFFHFFFLTVTIYGQHCL